ncbi:MAG TPA: preprotein translocase subunit SecY [Lachnospiraceae bacterium]|nr:preprotein translocase subunit SecY [Lachnospiraceae bacterium]
MFKTLRDAFQVKEIRRRVFYVVFILVIIRLGSQIPVPGVDSTFFANYFANNSNDAYSFLNAFTGGGFSNFSILALSITPYITSSIIVQLLTIAIPQLEELQKDGQDGRDKLTRITRILTVALALMESVAMCIGFGNQLILEVNAINVIVVVACLTGGSAFLMWLGEQINEKGVGNGISIVLLINILSRIPVDMITLYENFVAGKTIAKAALAAVIIIAIIIVVIILTLILNGAERRIPVQYSQKMVGRRLVGGNSSHIPLKVNTGGVIPIIFASSIMSFPQIIVSFTGKNPSGWGGKIISMLSSGNWFDPNDWFSTLGIIVYIVLVIFFAYFYTSITFNPMEVADNMKKSGGFIPGIRPGKPTEEYLNSILKYIIFIGVVGLIIIAVIPYIFNGLFNANVSFGGTSLIIVVSVILETLKQIESMMLVRNYKGFLNS